MTKLKLGWYTRQGLWTLSLTAARPAAACLDAYHVLPRVAVADGPHQCLDAFGVMSYGLIFALVESVLLSRRSDRWGCWAPRELGA